MVLVCIVDFGLWWNRFFYLKSSSKIYSRKASVLIRDDSKSGGMSESAAFADLSLFGGKRNVDNEVLVFQSRHLMEEVARRLHLDMSYKVKNGLRSDELYTHSPVIVSFPDAEERQVIKVSLLLSIPLRYIYLIFRYR